MCFVFIIRFIFCKFSGPRAYPSLARGYEPGLGQTLTGLGLNSSLRAWAGLGLMNFCGPGPGLDSNC